MTKKQLFILKCLKRQKAFNEISKADLLQLDFDKQHLLDLCRDLDKKGFIKYDIPFFGAIGKRDGTIQYFGNPDIEWVKAYLTIEGVAFIENRRKKRLVFIFRYILLPVLIGLLLFALKKLHLWSYLE